MVVKSARAITGSPALTGCQAPGIFWLRNDEPQLYATIAHVLLPKESLRFRVAAAFATDTSDTAGTRLLDMGQRK